MHLQAARRDAVEIVELAPLAEQPRELVDRARVCAVAAKRRPPHPLARPEQGRCPVQLDDAEADHDDRGPHAPVLEARSEPALRGGSGERRERRPQGQCDEHDPLSERRARPAVVESGRERRGDRDPQQRRAVPGEPCIEPRGEPCRQAERRGERGRGERSREGERAGRERLRREPRGRDRRDQEVQRAAEVQGELSKPRHGVTLAHRPSRTKRQRGIAAARPPRRGRAHGHGALMAGSSRPRRRRGFRAAARRARAASSGGIAPRRDDPSAHLADAAGDLVPRRIEGHVEDVPGAGWSRVLPERRLPALLHEERPARFELLGGVPLDALVELARQRRGPRRRWVRHRQRRSGRVRERRRRAARAVEASTLADGGAGGGGGRCSPR